MTTNQYFNNYTASNEQSLVDSLVVEAIQIKGMDMKYIPRSLPNFDFLFAEDPTSVFNLAHPIEMYLENVDGFGGDGDIFSKFGYTIKKTAVICVAKSRFKTEFPNLPRPLEGDLIFMPVTNAVLEIKFVDAEDPFFQQGAQYVYKLKCELFEFSRETFESGDVEVDSIVGSILGGIDPATEVEPYGNNTEINSASAPLIEYDPTDPFGGR